jgi:hypothetical protein
VEEKFAEMPDEWYQLIYFTTLDSRMEASVNHKVKGTGK